MHSTPYRANQILFRREDQTRHRLLRFDADADLAWLILLGADTALPYPARYSSLIGEFVPEENESTDALDQGTESSDDGSLLIDASEKLQRYASTPAQQ